MKKLTINPIFRDLIPPLTESQKQVLEENLIRSGCREPIVVWKDQILDGHHRYEICHRKKIPFNTVEEHFESEIEAKLWMLDNQFGRRDVPDFVKIELALQFEELEKELAQERKTDGKVTERIGKKVGVSGEQVRRVKKILESASNEQLRKLRQDDATIREVFNALKGFNTPYEKVEMWTIDGKLMIRQDFHELLPPLAENELLGLEESIVREGCRDPIVVWNNIILDGHQRYKICCDRAIEYKTFDVSNKVTGKGSTTTKSDVNVLYA